MDKFKACVYIRLVDIRRANRVCEAILQHIQLFVCLYLKIISCLLLFRKFGTILTIVHDLAAKYERKLSNSDFRHLEKTSIKARKAQLDVNFLKNCQSLRVFPKFISYSLPNTSNPRMSPHSENVFFAVLLKKDLKNSRSLKWKGTKS